MSFGETIFFIRRTNVLFGCQHYKSSDCGEQEIRHIFDPIPFHTIVWIASINVYSYIYSRQHHPFTQTHVPIAKLSNNNCWNKQNINMMRWHITVRHVQFIHISIIEIKMNQSIRTRTLSLSLWYLPFWLNVSVMRKTW